MKTKSVVISINSSWNIVNFRLGLIRALRDSGFRVIALAPADAYSARLRDLGVEFRPIPMDNKGTSFTRDLRLLWRYWRALRELRPAVFLGYTAKPNVYGSIAARAVGTKVISNVSGLGTAFIRGGVLSRVLSFLYRVAFRGASTVFFQNEDDRDLFVERGIVTPAKARLLPGSGVDTERFRPSGKGREESEFAFLLVARMLWDKGVREYVEAARLVRAEIPHVRFRILGFLDVENRTAVPRSEVESWVAEGLIDYLGQAEDVRPFMAAADCVVLPSYREGLPRTLLEAGAMGKPLIASDVPGCRHIVRDGFNGLLCRVRDHRSLADAMLRIVRARPEERLSWGRNARALVESEYDERIVVGRYLEAIRDVLD